MKVYRVNYFKGKEIIFSLMYTSKKSAFRDVEYFKSGDATDIWMMVYVPDRSGCLKIESNEMVWEK